MSSDGNGLTEAAKAELRAAVRIVREDRLEKFFRERFPKMEDKPKETSDKPDVPPVNPPDDDKPLTGRKSSYWGEIFPE